MVLRGAGTGPAERWRCGHGDMVMRVRSQRAHRCTTLTCPQASPSGRLSTNIELVIAHRGHIVDRAPRSLGGPRLYGETRDFSRIHSSSLGRTCSHLTPHGEVAIQKAPASALVPPPRPLNS